MWFYFKYHPVPYLFFSRLLPKGDLYSSWLHLWNNLSTEPHLVIHCPPWEADGCSSTQEVIQNYPEVRVNHLILSWPVWIQSHFHFICLFPSIFLSPIRFSVPKFTVFICPMNIRALANLICFRVINLTKNVWWTLQTRKLIFT